VVTGGRGVDAVVGDFGVGSLLERERELELLDRCLADAQRARGRLVVVDGPAGIGKTSLLRAATEQARGRGLTVLAARGAPLEQNFSYGAVRQLFEPLSLRGGRPADDDILIGAATLALRALGQGEPGRDSSAEDLSFSTLHGLYWLTANLASRAPLLLIVDDCQWADGASMRFLAYLGARLDGLRVLVVVAMRSGDRAAYPELLGEVRSLATGEAIRPPPLGTDGAACVVRGHLDSATDGFCRACHTATGGNPLLLHSLVAALVAEGIDPNDETAARVTRYGTESISRQLARRLALLPTGAAAFVRALAVLGQRSPLRHLADLAGLDLERAADIADALRAASILAPSLELDFAHPILRVAADEMMGPDERALTHARAAKLLWDDGAPPDRLALHLLHAHPRGDVAVVEVLRAAAAVAAGRGAPETAAACLRRALDEPPPRVLRGPLLLELGLAQMATRRDPLAVAKFCEAITLIEVPRDRLAAALRAGRALGVAGYFDEAAAILEQVPGFDLRIEAELAANHCQIATQESATLAHLVPYRDTYLPPGEGRQLMLVMLAHRSLCAGDPAAVAAALLERACQGPELLAAESLVTVYAAMDLMLVDRLDDAERLCTAVTEDAQRRGAASTVATFAFPRAFAFLHRGMLRDAEADARWSFEQKMSMGVEHGPPWPLACLVESLTELGDFTGAEEALAKMSTFNPRQPDMLAWAFVIEARGRLRVAQGNTREGIADLLEAGRRWDRLRCFSAGIVRWRGDAAVALAQIGEKDEARRLAAEQLELAKVTGLARVIGSATLVAGVVAPRGHRLSLLGRAVGLLEQSPARLELSRALVECGAAIRRDGRAAQARDPLRRGLELAHRAGAAPLAQRARDELVAAGGRPRRPVFTGIEALTASEFRVARLAAEGRTNRETAERLFVTQRTVETHLAHVFQKLSIKGRDELPRELAAP
jgi:DNA-binding CsgD family transcriptional regulator